MGEIDSGESGSQPQPETGLSKRLPPSRARVGGIFARVGSIVTAVSMKIASAGGREVQRGDCRLCGRGMSRRAASMSPAITSAAKEAHALRVPVAESGRWKADGHLALAPKGSRGVTGLDPDCGAAESAGASAPPRGDVGREADPGMAAARNVGPLPCTRGDDGLLPCGSPRGEGGAAECMPTRVSGRLARPVSGRASSTTSFFSNAARHAGTAARGERGVEGR